MCRECGADVVDAGYIIQKLSPVAIVLANRTLFDIKGVNVQFLTNLGGVTFSTIALSTASCVGAPAKVIIFYKRYMIMIYKWS